MIGTKITTTMGLSLEPLHTHRQLVSRPRHGLQKLDSRLLGVSVDSILHHDNLLRIDYNRVS